MIALLLAINIGQTEDVAELHDRYEIAESVFSDELSRHNKSAPERYEANDVEPLVAVPAEPNVERRPVINPSC